MRLFTLLVVVLSLGCSGTHVFTDSVDAGLASDAALPSDAAVPSDAFCVSGAALPTALVGFFHLTPVDCQPHGASSGRGVDFVTLSVDACGATRLGVPDGIESTGMLRRLGDAFVYEETLPRDGALAFTLRVLAEHRAGAPVLLLNSTRSDDAWQAWALRQPGIRAVEPPPLHACAVSQTWTTHLHDGVAAGPALSSRERRYVPGEEAPRFELGPTPSADWARSRFWLRDQGVELGGTVTAWDGRLGSAATGACGELDASVTFAQEGERWTIEVDWLVPDVSDLDVDGLRTDFYVRRAHYEARADACAP